MATQATHMILMRHDYEGMQESSSAILTMVQTLIQKWSLNTVEDLKKISIECGRTFPLDTVQVVAECFVFSLFWLFNSVL